ncbi:class I SAM-dependent methyltransferase [Marinobacter salinexigens]|uniref:Class I SAM-dependent methyltransferase n=1 Tax=Marinobacter salinexigens TaxID=2919747 RepID=A0A5B0VCY8_9GAMM|nr:class I SAM-dependent methyltransferase [Marinobacter salinexigens]KAA1172055.1 class I SAM-dependent methyltransferase [Marinobacter salinexigens]
MAVGRQDYLRCGYCEATVMSEVGRLSEAEERAVYDLHENTADDPGYRRFLARLSDPLLKRLAHGADGLDFGCGPGPALAQMLADSGMNMSLYDPFFYPDASVLERQYDFITCTEVVEHLYQPAEVFQAFDRLLLPGGWLGVMTCFQTDDSRFANWHYRRDPTHVVFYREYTFNVLAQQFGWRLEVPAKDVALFHKPIGTC